MNKITPVAHEGLTLDTILDDEPLVKVPSLEDTDKSVLPEESSKDEEPTISDMVRTLLDPQLGDGLPPMDLWVEEGKNLLEFDIYVYKDLENGRMIAIVPEVNMPFRSLDFVEYPIHSKWTIPTKAQMERYENENSVLDRTVGRVIVNRHGLNRSLLKHHLIDLTIHERPEGGGEPRLIQLRRDKEGSLDEETLKKILKLHPSAQAALLSRFHQEAVL